MNMSDKEVSEVEKETRIQLVTFCIENEEYGMDILHVQEIIRMIEITKMPNVPDFMDGVINLRGKVIAVVNLRKRFGLAPKDRDNLTRVIVVNLKGMVMGFVVDAVSEVLRIPANTVDPTPSVVENCNSNFVSGVGKLQNRLLIFINLAKIMDDHELNQLKQLSELSD